MFSGGRRYDSRARGCGGFVLLRSARVVAIGLLSVVVVLCQDVNEVNVGELWLLRLACRCFLAAYRHDPRLNEHTKPPAPEGNMNTSCKQYEWNF